MIRHETERPASTRDEKPQRNFNEALRQLRDPDIELARRLGRPLPDGDEKVVTVPVGGNSGEQTTEVASVEADNVETLMSERPGETLEGD